MSSRAHGALGGGADAERGRFRQSGRGVRAPRPVERFQQNTDLLQPAEAYKGAAVLAAEEAHKGGEADTGGVGDAGHRKHHREADGVDSVDLLKRKLDESMI